MLPYVVKINPRRSNFTLYIGREFAGLPASKWQNPFHEYQYGRSECIKMYEQHVRSNTELMAAIAELSDQALGCWCYPQDCHGDVLVKVYKEVCKPGVGDMAQGVSAHGELVRTAPGLIAELFSTSDGVEYVRFEDQLGFWPRKDTVWP